jgi:hypothetical protein
MNNTFLAKTLMFRLLFFSIIFSSSLHAQELGIFEGHTDVGEKVKPVLLFIFPQPASM